MKNEVLSEKKGEEIGRIDEMEEAKTEGEAE